MPTVFCRTTDKKSGAIVYDKDGIPHFFVFKKILWWTKAVEVKE